MIRTLVLIGIALVAAGQEKQEAPKSQSPPTVRRVVDVKHLTGDRADRAVALVNKFLHPVGNMSFDPVLRTAVLIGPEDVVKSAEALFAKFDNPNAVRPESQVQFRMYLVEASPDASLGGPVPKEIEGALTQMRKSFVYEGYRLLDTLLVQSRGSGGVETSGTLTTQGEDNSTPRTTYNLRMQHVDVLEDNKTIMIRNFRFGLRIPAQSTVGMNFVDSGINTDLTLQPGQKLVVGNMPSVRGKNTIFVIITADVH